MTKSARRAWHQARLELDAAAVRLWRARNPHKIAEYRRRYREEHRAELAEYARQWRIAHPDCQAWRKKRLQRVARGHPRVL